MKEVKPVPESEINKTSEEIMKEIDQAAKNADEAARKSTTTPLDMNKLSEPSENTETTVVEPQKVEEKKEEKVEVKK